MTASTYVCRGRTISLAVRNTVFQVVWIRDDGSADWLRDSDQKDVSLDGLLDLSRISQGGGSAADLSAYQDLQFEQTSPSSSCHRCETIS